MIRGGDVHVALFQSLTNGDEDVASPFHAGAVQGSTP